MSKEYKWSLRRGGKKMRCPACGKMRFVPFVLTADGRTLAGEEFGRCDREQSCGYFRYPSGVSREGVRVERQPELPGGRFELSLVYPSMYSVKINSLYRAFADLVGRDRLLEMFELYRIGTGAHGECLFPQYDGECLRTAKAIRYDVNGHRLKDAGGAALPVYWLHKSPMFKEYMSRHKLEQCLFGQHLLKLREGAEVWVVEAEKTALLMAATDEREDRVWLACGGSQMMKGAIDLRCLQGREVTLVPDDGQFWNWKRTADFYGWRTLDVMEGMPDGVGVVDGCDVWDIKELELRGI